MQAESSQNTYRSADQRLSDFFPINNPRASFSDFEFQQIAFALKNCGRQSWSLVPRLYTVLRTIDQLEFLDNFIEEGISDVWFPFTNSRLPKTLSSPMQAKFLEIQPRVCTKGLSLETNGEKPHAHFSSGEEIPFKVQELLGQGASQVHKITSLISGRSYARKQFRRFGNSRTVKNEIKTFLAELQILKRLHHQHCVQLVASYTDSRYFAIIMSPVADYNLLEFYTVVAQDPAKKPILRHAFGCLAEGVAYLHGEKVRHRDIKPQNILVKDNQVYLTDFGISLDWINLSRSTTTADSAKTWIYCAPEVANYKPRNSASDIWSLGCVYLEMATVLRDLSLEDLRTHFKQAGGDGSEAYWYWKNTESIGTWSNYLRTRDSSWDNITLDWATQMLKSPSERPTAADLVNIIREFKRYNPDCQVSYYGVCCEHIGDPSDGSDSDDSPWADHQNSIDLPICQPLLDHLDIIVGIDSAPHWTVVAWCDAKNPHKVYTITSWSQSPGPGTLSSSADVRLQTLDEMTDYLNRLCECTVSHLNGIFGLSILRTTNVRFCIALPLMLALEFPPKMVYDRLNLSPSYYQNLSYVHLVTSASDAAIALFFKNYTTPTSRTQKVMVCMIKPHGVSITIYYRYPNHDMFRRVNFSDLNELDFPFSELSSFNNNQNAASYNKQYLLLLDIASFSLTSPKVQRHFFEGELTDLLFAETDPSINSIHGLGQQLRNDLKVSTVNFHHITRSIQGTNIAHGAVIKGLQSLHATRKTTGPS